MHRSYTSLVASAFHAGGMHLGDDLIGATASNPYGHFESQAIVDFHRQVIKQNRLSSWWSKINKEKAQTVSTSSNFLLAAQASWKPKDLESVVGWKDPRATFFLDGWAKAYPQAKFIVLVRHPVEVVRSLNKRVKRNSGSLFSPFLTTRHMNHWLAANRAILRSSFNHPDRIAILCSSYLMRRGFSDSIINQQLIKWGIDLSISLSDVIDDTLVSTSIKEDRVSWYYNQRGDVADIFEALCERDIFMASPLNT